MILTLRRFASMVDWTLGAFFVDGQFECFTLEDEARTVKIDSETRIPRGRYEIKFQKVGRLHDKYAEKFGAEHHGMLALQDVPNFAGVMLHMGATTEHTAGCPLLADTAMSSGALANSQQAYKRVYARVSEALLRGERVVLDVLDQ